MAPLRRALTGKGRAGATQGYGGLGKTVRLLLVPFVPVFTPGNRTWREITGGKEK
ncbi:MAG TPA: hypothetical protein PKY58_13240 [Syntrophales bacterium]|nr:hypothetical protein [Syntrophales bacterium]HQB31606.1 hypothetical protein [Syntrophales bacterium]HQN79300.1 hypothetical protein [Syntrophales bacterium]HQQ28482.1 hypothetical protein [Syntrophales bacterium]